MGASIRQSPAQIDPRSPVAARSCASSGVLLAPHQRGTKSRCMLTYCLPDKKTISRDNHNPLKKLARPPLLSRPGPAPPISKPARGNVPAYVLPLPYASLFILDYVRNGGHFGRWFIRNGARPFHSDGQTLLQRFDPRVCGVIA